MTDDLDAVYRDRFPPATRARREAMWVEIARFLQRHVVPGSVLDIGCGEGSFIRNIVARERSKTLGTIIGASAGAIIGQSIDRGDVVCR